MVMHAEKMVHIGSKRPFNAQGGIAGVSAALKVVGTL